MNKELLSLLPPKFLKILLSLKNNGYRWTGNFSTFEEALAQSTGYETPDIIDKTINRGIVEDQKHEISVVSNMQLIGSLFLCLNHLQKNKVTILDFGGATGSHYRFIRHFLSPSTRLQYVVCETNKLVEKAAGIFSSKELSFIDDLKKFNHGKPDIIISSGTLQYLPNPAEIYDNFLHLHPGCIITNRIPIIEGNSDRLTVQHVPRQIYTGSYPCWFFSKLKWETLMQKKSYSILIKWDAKDEYVFLDGRKVYYSGYVVKRNT